MKVFSTHNLAAISCLSLFLSMSLKLSAETLNISTSYNEKGEVTNFVCLTYHASWVYDQMGNRICSTLLNATNYYTVNNLNQYTVITNNLGESVSLQYDEDGNLIRDYVFNFEWDAENRLKRSYPVNMQNGGLLVENSYDYQHRRVKKTVSKLVDFDNSQPSSPTNGRFINEYTSKFIYINNRMAAEICVKSTGVTNSTYYVWGADLSGELDGAGGVGGLLMVVKDGVTYYPICDANGNIREYLDSNGLSVAQFVYTPFGELVASCGTMKDSFALRFSSKYFDKETSMYDYGRRFYHPWYGRWISRDPIGIRGGLNEVGFVENDAINYFDVLGQKKKSSIPPSPKARQWTDKQLSATESHVWNCMEWESGYGTYDEYIKHFMNITFNPSFMNNPPPHVPVDKRPQVAGSLVSAFGMTSDMKACWDIELKNIRLSYTNIEVISDTSCESKKRNVRHFKVKAHVESMCKHPYPCTKKGHPVSSMDRKDVETIEHIYRLKCVSE